VSATTSVSWYRLHEPEAIASPCLIVYKERLISNIDDAIRTAGSAQRLRPHVKTHKSADVVGLHLELGVDSFKCATVAEAEMLAGSGARDVLLAYQPVGPSIERYLTLARRNPRVRFGCLVDNPASVDVLDVFAERHGVGLTVFVDLDTGMHRTGIAPGTAADELYARVSSARWLVAGGIHSYDGHSTASDRELRDRQAAESRMAALAMRGRLLAAGLAVPEVILGGTPSFTCHADAIPTLDEGEREAIRLSPGTYGYFDWGYATRFPDLPFRAAALVLGRVISVPEPGRFTIDVGSKAIAADPDAPRGILLNLPTATAGPQSEEHWVFTIEPAQTPPVGAVVYVWPKHICPTVEHYDRVGVVGPDRTRTEWWPVTARSH